MGIESTSQLFSFEWSDPQYWLVILILVVSKGKTTRCSLDNVIAHYDILGVDSQTDAFQEGKVTVSVQSMMSIYKVPILCE